MSPRPTDVATGVENTSTPYRRSSTGKVHSKRCNVGWSGDDMTLSDVVDWVRQHGGNARWVVVGAQCCGSLPELWLQANHPDVLAELEADR